MISESFYATLTKLRKRDFVTLQCDCCNAVFQTIKGNIYLALKNNKHPVMFCSLKCSKRYQDERNKSTAITVPCGNCGKNVLANPYRLNASCSGQVFCSKSCAAKYNNAHKTKGTRRSNLEIYLEKTLNSLYPTLTILYNNKETINSELDIYIPTLSLAFELNGLFHYEPIYGLDKLNAIQNNDARKFQACLEHGIELCIIDTTHQKRFTESSSLRYLTVIKDIINSKLLVN